MMLESEEDFHHGIETLIARDPEMAALLAVAGRPKLRRNEAGFSGLAGIIVSQQLSTASANAIWGKVIAKFPGLTAEMIHAASDEELRSVGLSSPKIRALRAAATAVSENVLPLDDIGLINGISRNYFSGEAVSRSDAREVAAAWAPYCSVATWYIWRSLDPQPVAY